MKIRPFRTYRKGVPKPSDQVTTIREYRPGHFQISGRYNHKRFWIQKGGNGKPFRSFEEAFLWQTLVEEQIKSGKFIPEEWSGRNPWRFDVAIEKWVKDNPSNSEYKKNKKWLVDKFLIPFFKQTDFRKINDSDVSSFYRHLKQLTYLDPHKEPHHYSDKRVKDIMAELKGFLNSKKHHFQKFPDFPKIRVQQPVIEWLDKKQQNEVFQFIPREDKLVFTFLRYTGCRPNEAGGLLRQNVHPDKGYFVLATAMTVGGKVRETTKTKIARQLPIIEEIKHCFDYKQDSMFVFTTPLGRPYSTKMLAERWKRASDSAHKKYGTPKINLYNGLKHSFATQRLAKGFSLDEIKEVLGHTTSTTTKRYAQYLTFNLKNVMSGRSPKISRSFSELTTRNKRKKRLGGKDSNLG